MIGIRLSSSLIRFTYVQGERGRKATMNARFTEMGRGYSFKNGQITLIWDHNQKKIVAAPYKLKEKYTANKGK